MARVHINYRPSNDNILKNEDRPIIPQAGELRVYKLSPEELEEIRRKYPAPADAKKRPGWLSIRDDIEKGISIGRIAQKHCVPKEWVQRMAEKMQAEEGKVV